ncbi:MAG: oxidoreductase [Cyclobacteriaceae bacterium]|nr:MAG: oxidoreductase [Cyclobacteriaceae bacterium]
MKKISWLEATSIEEAQRAVNTTVSDALNKNYGKGAIIKSGGIDVLDLMKEGLIAPDRIINIRNIPGLDQIQYDAEKGLRIGANVTLAEIEGNKDIGSYYLALQQSVAKAATPQLRNMSTLGGNLAQRTRCWYFRSKEHACFRKGGAICFAKNGENEYHAIIDNGTCSSVYASSVATALLALDASVEIATMKGERKQVKMGEFFVPPWVEEGQENILEQGEIITAISIPPLKKGVKSYYIKQGARASYDWALADVAVVVEMSGKKCKKAIIALGAAAPIPIRVEDAESILVNEGISEESVLKAADVAMEKAKPLEKNGYKVAIFKTIIKRAIDKTTS